MAITTPLDKDFLLLNSFNATEGLSQLYTIETELLHEEEEVSFQPTIVDPKEMLGANVSIEVRAVDGTSRELNGIVNRFTQGNRDTRFSYYNATIVPHIWVLTQKVQSQIFQQISVPEILKRMFEGFDVKYELQRTYEPRNYCVQYRESDFDFASRLMEEEGIFYFFVHIDGKDRMVVADTPQSHPVCPTKNEVQFFVNVGDDDDFISVVNSFLSGYNLQTGKVTLWDANFQLPGKNLERQEMSVFTYGDNKKFEHYDYPAGYARKYDGVSNSGGDQASELQKVFPDRDVTTKNWMESLDVEVETATGRGDCSSFHSGHKFTLKDHPNADLNKTYVLTTIQHSAHQNPAYSTGDPVREAYVNSFTCIAFGSGKPCFRPQRVTPKPTVNGSQTAFVVGPAGEEIFVDKFGRVKVQFHWDRDGKMDSNSSCWVRCAQAWAGHNWGGMFIPRIGMEVLVHFLEGDPDEPIITGCVYNPVAMPPYKLPDEKTKSTIKSNSTKGGGGFNEIRFEDKKGSEQIFIHGQKDLDVRILNDRREWTGNDQHLIVKRDRIEKIERDDHLKVIRHQQEEIGGDHHLKVTGNENIAVTGSRSVKVTGGYGEETTANRSIEAGGTILVKGTSVTVDATAGITLKCGGNFVTVNAAGVQIQGTMVLINSGGAPIPGAPAGTVSPQAPLVAKEADDAKPGTITKLQKESAQSKQEKSGKEDEEKKSWITIKLVDEAGEPVRGEKFKIIAPDGREHSGATDANGLGKVKGIDPGSCEVRFPNLDKEAWKEG